MKLLIEELGSLSTRGNGIVSGNRMSTYVCAINSAQSCIDGDEDCTGEADLEF
jgi:hypothetical protein